jgi:hypothetical protein
VPNVEALQASYADEYDLIENEIIMEIDELNEKAHLCDYEIIYQCAMKNTILTTMPTELISLGIYDIMSIIKSEDIKILRRNVKKVPSSYEVLDFHLRNRKWVKFKNCY